ncbi:MAG TPA: mechanosensitive ion channel family protein, partial [Candidatus Dorea intestinigallinarum]|nr:mechanosensitive ion channel family protein [Candidatus Dorea intestinigallinarum]
VRRLTAKAFARSNADTGVSQFTDSIIKYGLYTVLVILVVTSFGVNLSSITAILAAAGVAVSLALQDVISNFAGGVLILTLKPFAVGDYIIEDNNKNEGTVKEIQLFHTKLTTVDNKTIVIPNGMLTNNSLTNVTAKDERQLDLRIDISYESDLRKAKGILEDMLKSTPGILRDMETSVFVDSLGTSSVVLGIRAWTRMEDYWPVRWKLLEDIKLTFDEEGINIPYTQITVHSAGKE